MATATVLLFFGDEEMSKFDVKINKDTGVVTSKGQVLNAQQCTACREYVLSDKKAQSLRRAGYSNPSEYTTRFFNKPSIAEYVNYLRERIDEVLTEDVAVLDKRGVLISLSKIVDKALTNKDYDNAIKALDKLGKHYGIYDNKQVLDITIKNPIQEILEEIKNAK